ncbi:MAG: hypothetical protein AMK70_11250 [Nitrospira bacterium SG8_35_1]|nr:MAG: hypothetical protein AMK70_11250 [Nitrospira bacterium SG8_35_1]
MMSRLHTGIPLLLFLLSVIIFGCISSEERPSDSEYPTGQFTLYLNGPDKAFEDITFDLSSINVLSEEGLSRELTNTPLTVNSQDISGRQVLLSEKSLPEGRYVTIRMFLSGAALIKNGRMATLALPREAIEVPISAVIEHNRNTSVFIHWEPDASIVDSYLFSPALTSRGQVPELSSLLIYVTNEGSNNVSVINRKTNTVVASILVGERPRGIAVSKNGERLRVYVANSGSNNIAVINPTTNRIENEVPIRFGKGPEGIAVARISSGREFVFVTNYDSNSLSVINAVTLQEVEKIDVGIGPIVVAADPPVSLLAHSRSLTADEMNTLKNFRQSFFNVYVVNQHSNTVSIVRMDNASGTKVDVTTLDVEWEPVGLSVDYPRGKVYVANYGSDKLSVIDILEIIKGNTSGAVTVINNVGKGVTGVIPDTIFERIYLLKDFPGEIMILRAFGKGFESIGSVLTPIMGTIPVGQAPRSLLLDPEKRTLYVVNSESDSVSVVDKTTKRQVKRIPVGRKPYGIAMFPE